MINSQLIANQINAWLNINSTDFQGEYDLTADYNPLEQERVNNAIELFLGNPDNITKQEIENDKIRGVVQAGVAKKNEVFNVDASAPIFQVSIRTDATKTTVLDDLNKLIEEFNGLVTKETLTDGKYFYAWGFNSISATETENINGVRFLTLVLSGQVTITRSSATVRAGHFGDDFTVAITPPTLTEQAGVDVISIAPKFVANLDRLPAGAGEEILNRYNARDIDLVMILTRGSELGKYYMDVLFQDDEDADTALKITWAREAGDVTYNWNAILKGISAPIQLGDFIFISVGYAKS